MFSCFFSHPWFLSFFSITEYSSKSNSHFCSGVVQCDCQAVENQSSVNMKNMEGHTANSNSSNSSDELRRNSASNIHSKTSSSFSGWNPSNTAPVDLTVPSSVASTSSSSSNMASSLPTSLPMFANVGLTNGLINSFGKTQRQTKRVTTTSPASTHTNVVLFV